MSDWLKNDGKCNCDKCRIDGMLTKLSDFEARLSAQEALQREVVEGLKAIRDALANDGK